MFGFNPTGDIDYLNSSLIGLTLHDPNNQGEKISIQNSDEPIDLILKKDTTTTNKEISFQFVNISNLSSTNNGYLTLGLNLTSINSTVTLDIMPEQNTTLSTFGLLLLVKNGSIPQLSESRSSYAQWTVRCPNSEC